MGLDKEALLPPHLLKLAPLVLGYHAKSKADAEPYYEEDQRDEVDHSLTTSRVMRTNSVNLTTS